LLAALALLLQLVLHPTYLLLVLLAVLMDLVVLALVIVLHPSTLVLSLVLVWVGPCQLSLSQRLLVL
jgi:hypothetical protein